MKKKLVLLFFNCKMYASTLELRRLNKKKDYKEKKEDFHDYDTSDEDIYDDDDEYCESDYSDSDYSKAVDDCFDDDELIELTTNDLNRSTTRLRELSVADESSVQRPLIDLEPTTSSQKIENKTTNEFESSSSFEYQNNLVSIDLVNLSKSFEFLKPRPPVELSSSSTSSLSTAAVPPSQVNSIAAVPPSQVNSIAPCTKAPPSLYSQGDSVIYNPAEETLNSIKSSTQGPSNALKKKVEIREKELEQEQEQLAKDLDLLETEIQKQDKKKNTAK